MEYKNIEKIIECHINKSEKEAVKILHSIGRVCAKNIFAQIDIPNFSKSKYDGYIIHRIDYKNWMKCNQLQLPIIDKIGAGHSISRSFNPGTTYHIMTGAELPIDAKYVVPFEMLDGIENNRIIINGIPGMADTVIPKGSKIKRGQLILEEGTMIERQNIFKIADQGFEYIDVYKKPMVSIISTGDEVIEIGMPYERGKIYNSTSYAIAADVILSGGQLHAIDHVEDNLHSIIQTIQHCLSRSNIIITTGGLGDGKYDYTKDIHKHMDTNIVYKIMDRPPRIIISKIDDKWIINCSGTPNATFFSLDYVIKPIINRMLGHSKKVE